MSSNGDGRAAYKQDRDNSNSRDRSRSRDNRVQLVKEEDADNSYAKVDHFAKNRQSKKPPIPKEVLQIEEELFKARDENTKLVQDNEKNESRVKAIELFSSDVLRRYDRLEHEYTQLKQQYDEL